MKLVIIESPFKQSDTFAERDHREYLNKCILDCILRGESPYASHKMLVDSLDDTNPQEREMGIDAGFAWAAQADKAVFYIDHGISHGMLMAAYRHGEAGLGIEVRSLA